MRISVFCGGTYVSGMEIKALDLFNGLLDRGHGVHVLVSGWNDGDFVSRLDASSIPYTMIYHGKLTIPTSVRRLWLLVHTLARCPRALVKVSRHIEGYNPDVVLLFNRDSTFLAAPALRGRKCVFHAAELPEATPWTRWLYSTMDGLVSRWIGVSVFMGQRLEELGIAREKIRVVYNGIPEVSDAEAGRTVHSKEPAIIGICGQIGEWKGHDLLFEALHLLAERGSAFRCLVFGRGQDGYENTLRKNASRAGISHFIEWRGFAKDTTQMYRAIDILVVPSRCTEAFGLVAAEAGIRCIPVVASQLGGLPEIVVDGETGFIVDAENIEELADRLGRLISSPDLRLQMGVAARERMKRLFTLDNMVQGHERVFQELVPWGESPEVGS